MTTTRSGVLLRSLPVLFSLVLALFSPHQPVVTASPASGPVVVSAAPAEQVARTAEAAPAETTVEPVAQPPAFTTEVEDRAAALAGRAAVGPAGSRAPPAAA